MHETEAIWNSLLTTLRGQDAARPPEVDSPGEVAPAPRPVLGPKSVTKWRVDALIATIADHLLPVSGAQGEKLRREMETSNAPALDQLLDAAGLQRTIQDTLGESFYVGLVSRSEVFLSCLDARIFATKLDNDAFAYRVLYTDGFPARSLCPLTVLDESGRISYGY